MSNFLHLDVRRKSHALTLDICQITANFPTTERYGLSSQLQRAAASKGANLAEGCGRETDLDFRRFVQIASGSACELEYHLILSKDLASIDEQSHESLDFQVNEVKRMLVGLSRYPRSRLDAVPATTTMNGNNPLTTHN